MLKKHTHKSKNILIIPLTLKVIICIKIIIFVAINEINKHKGKIYNHCTYTIIIITEILLFFFTEYKNE